MTKLEANFDAVRNHVFILDGVQVCKVCCDKRRVNRSYVFLSTTKFIGGWNYRTRISNSLSCFIEPMSKLGSTSFHREACSSEVFLLIFLNVNDGRLELPGSNLAVEQDVSLTIRAVLQLRKE